MTETEYEYTPLRIWDLEPGQTGKTKNIDVPIAGWAADWRDLSHNHEVRWPYVFVSAYEDGLQVFDLKDPTAPHTDGWYYTCECTHMHGFGGTPDNGWESTISVEQGAFGVDVRNCDGLIALSDMRTRSLAVPIEGLRWLERRQVRRSAGHLQRAGLRPRSCWLEAVIDGVVIRRSGGRRPVGRALVRAGGCVALLCLPAVAHAQAPEPP